MICCIFPRLRQLTCLFCPKKSLFVLFYICILLYFVTIFHYFDYTSNILADFSRLNAMAFMRASALTLASVIYDALSNVNRRFIVMPVDIRTV